MCTKRIIDLQSITVLSSGDYVIVDNSTAGTKKYDLYKVIEKIDNVGSGTGIANSAILARHIADGVLDTIKFVDASITSAKLASSAVTTAKINDSAVTTAKIADAAITTAKIASSAVASGNIASGAVTTVKINDGAVSTDKLASGAVTTAKINDSAVTSGKLDASAVTTAKIANSAVTTAKINDSAVTTDKLANGSVTLAKIASGSDATTSASGLMSAADKTKLNGFSNASDYALKSELSSVYRDMGSVATENNLPTSGQKVGDVYNIIAESSYGPAGTNVVWTGNSVWDSLGGLFVIADGAITTVKLANSAVTTAKITDAAVTSDKIAAGAIGSAKLADGAVSTAKIDDGAISTAKIAGLAVTEGKIANGAVTTDKLGSSAVIEGKIASNAVTTAKINNGAVTTDKIANSAITTAKINNSAVTTDKINAGAVTTAKVADGNITTDKLGSSAVTTAKVADGAITEGKLASGAVTAGKIGSGAVVTDKLDSSAVTTAKIADGAVSTDKIYDLAVTTGKINTGAVTMDKMAQDVNDTFASKADSDGHYPLLTSGFSDNLKGRGDSVVADYLYRPTAGSQSDVSDGTASMKTIRGKTLVWNQIATQIDWSGSGVTVAWSNDVCLISGSPTGVVGPTIASSNNIVPGHKYIVKCDGMSSANGIDRFEVNFRDSNNNVKQEFVKTLADYSNVVTAGDYSTKFVAIAVIYGGTDPSASIRVNVIDLTLMFGAGNEPSTIAEFEALFPKPYYPYDAGSLLNVNMLGIKTVGFNQWDEEWAIRSQGGNQYFVNKNPIPVFPNTTYYIKTPYDTSIDNVDSDGIYKSYIGGRLNNTFTTPSDCHYIRFLINTSDYGTTYKNDICINLHWSGYRDGEYEPYWSQEREIDVATYFPDGMKSVGTVHDELTPTKAIKRVEKAIIAIETGVSFSVNETANTSGLYNHILTYTQTAFSAKGFDDVELSDSSVFSATLLSSLGVSNAVGFSNATVAGVAMNKNERKIYLRWPTILTEQQFTTLLSTGHNNELLFVITPVETPIDPPLNMDYEVSDFGTEEVMVDTTQPAPQSAPPNMDVVYTPNAIDSIRRLPVTMQSHASHDEFQRVLGEQLGLTITETYDSSDGRYEYGMVPASGRTLAQTQQDVAAIRDIIRGTVHEPNSWEEIAALADDAADSRDFFVGTQIIDTFADNHGSSVVNYDCPFVLQHFQKVRPTGASQDVNAAIIGMLHALPFATEFDAKEAFYACPSGGKAADTYYFTFGTTWGSKIISGTSYSFTTTTSHPEGAQFVFSGDPYSNDAATMKVRIYDTPGGTTLSEECQISSGIASGATQLCTLSASQIGTNDSQNHLHRCIYGNNNWAESAIRQFLNSNDTVGGQWWTPQNKWDRPPSYASYKGFLTMLPPELVAVIEEIEVKTALSYSADAGSSSDVQIVTTHDKIWLPSWEQHYLKVDSSFGGTAGAEGEAFEYWKKVAGVSTPWAAYTTHEEFIHTGLELSNGVHPARLVFLRGPSRGTGYGVTSVGTSGDCDYGSALYGHYVVPVCAIRPQSA